jgi:hypothetical protein
LSRRFHDDDLSPVQDRERLGRPAPADHRPARVFAGELNGVLSWVRAWLARECLPPHRAGDTGAADCRTSRARAVARRW